MTCDLERIVMMIDSLKLEVVAVATMDWLETAADVIVAPSSYHSVVADTYQRYWVATPSEAACYWQSNKGMVVRMTAVALVVAACMTKTAFVGAEGIAVVDRDN